MRRYKLLLSLLFMAVVLFVSTTAELRGQSQAAPPQKKQPTIDDTEIPLADFDSQEAGDGAKRARRQAKGKKYDRSRFRVDPSDLGGATSLGDVVDTTIPAFPLSQSKAVIIGEVIDAQAYLSNDKTGVYSEFTVLIDETLKNDSDETLTQGSTVEAQREGGRVRFPTGRIQRYSVDRLRMPRLGQRYLLFLTSENKEQGLNILTGYELREGKIFPLDNLPLSQVYKNVDETPFLKELRSMLIHISPVSSQ